MEVVRRKVADVKSKNNNLMDAFCRDTFRTYASIQHSVDRLLLAEGIRLTETNDLENEELRQGVYVSFCIAWRGFQKSFEGATEAVDRNLSLIAEH